MTEDKKRPIGQLFTHVYLERGEPKSDSPRARKRLSVYLNSELRDWIDGLSTVIEREMGLTVPHSGMGLPNYEQFFARENISDVLALITIICRFLLVKGSQTLGTSEYYVEMARKWLSFVKRVFKEENLGYTVDSAGGVHYLVDEEFERNRVSLLRCLDLVKYSAVRSCFEDAHRHLDADPRDTKAAVRSMFESIETMTKIMVKSSDKLNRGVVQKKLSTIGLSTCRGDPVATDTITKVFQGFGLWVDGLQNYRHGHRTQEPVAPSLDLAIYVISSGAAFLRWLVEIDRKIEKTSLEKIE